MDDDALWLPFNEAKDTLFMALLHPSQPIHWQTPSASPAMRDAHRKATTEVVSTLQAAESKLEALQQEAKAVQHSISRHRAAAQNALAPVALLPPELIREIVDLTVEFRWNYSRILKLSHVSRLWRDVVLQYPALFTLVDFRRWPRLMIETWLLRSSEHHLLDIELDDRIRKDELDSRLSLLWSLSTRIGVLSLSLSSYEDIITSGLLSIKMSRLRRLHVEGCDEISRNCRIESKNMPSLRILSLQNVFPEIPVPISGITDLIYTTYLPLLSQQLEEILSKLPGLRNICLAFGEVEDTTPRIRLPPFMSLELAPYRGVPFDAFRKFTVTFPFPNLQSLTLRGAFEGYQRKCYENLPTYILSLVRMQTQNALSTLLTYG